VTLSQAEGLGAWAQDDLASTVRWNYGRGVDADLSPPLRMLGAVARVARRRRLQDTAAMDSGAPAVFLLRQPAFGMPAVTNVPMVDTGLHRLSGRVWFVNEVFYSGKCVEAPGDDAELFTFVNETLQCGEEVAVIYDPRLDPPELRLYRSGLATPDDCTVVSVEEFGSITLDHILSVVDHVWEKLLVTPDSQDEEGRLWASPSQFRPYAQAERRVQMHLRDGLAVAFPTCDIRKEQPGTPGRIDLLIEEADPAGSGSITAYAVLELKVLRSKLSTGIAVSDAANSQAIDDGIRQAATYRDDRHALEAALCCFDMRRQPTGDTIFDDHRTTADTNGVVLRLWFLFANYQQYRRAMTL
jgi:hypothetical protein